MSRSLKRAGRLIEIETLLFHHPDGLRITDLAGALGVNRRTIYRDIDLLSEAGVPIWQIEGRYGIIRERYLAIIRLSFNEAVALYIATRLLARHADERNPYVVSALNKLATAVPRPLAAYISRTAENIQSQPVNQRFMQVLETLSLCWGDNYRARIWYRSPRSNQLRERLLDPYMIEPSSTGGLYAVGYDSWANGIRTFNLDRLEKAERTSERYLIPADFDPTRYLEHAWGIMTGEETVIVELRFSPQVAPIVRERTWHPSQAHETLPDGSIRFQVKVSDWREMRPWIRSWGAEVEVLQPAILREELAGESRRLSQLYRPG